MNIWRLLLYLAIGTVLMLIPIMIQGKWYQIKCSTRALIAVLLTVAGTLGTILLFFIENGRFGGTSFYGAVFFVPLAFLPVARWLQIPYGKLMDLCAPAECIMLAVMKVQCLTTGCCGGRTFLVNGKEFVFPSQIVELATALILCVVLLLVARAVRNRGKVFPWYMILYGAARFVLNLFRNVKNMIILPMPLGNFWSIVSIVIGVIWLISVRKRYLSESKEQTICL